MGIVFDLLLGGLFDFVLDFDKCLVGGFGVYFFKIFMDEVFYCCIECYNCLWFVKYVVGDQGILSILFFDCFCVVFMVVY